MTATNYQPTTTNSMYRQPFKGEYPITQQYGEIIPGVTYKDQPHTGIDYGCPIGTEILASNDGTVMYSEFDNTGYGFTVIIQHEDGKATLYAHLLTMRKVTVGQKVNQGDVIGYSGQTGNATGPHLHFEAREKWCDYRSHRDPVTFLPMQSVDDAAFVQQPATSSKTEQVQLKDADTFTNGDLLTVTAPLGAKAFTTDFSSYTPYPYGSVFYYTGQTIQRNGYTYMQVMPMPKMCWIAVHDNDTQILDK